MDFIKKLEKKKKSRISELGYAYLEDSKLTVKVFSKAYSIKDVGIIDGGIGCVMSKRDKECAKEQALTTRNLSDGDVPANLMSANYKFRIPAEKISDTEYVFMFDKACMVK